MKKVTREEFYQIIADNELDVVVNSRFYNKMCESTFKFRNGRLFGEVQEIDKFPPKSEYYICEDCYKQYKLQYKK